MSVMNATRYPNGVAPSTELQIHINHWLSDTERKGMFDMTEARLRTRIASAITPFRRETLTQMLSDYCGGVVAVAWKHGDPLPVKITQHR